MVKSVLDEAQRILQELRSYQGANEEIRQVSKFACYVFNCIREVTKISSCQVKTTSRREIQLGISFGSIFLL